jgi:hypothetical protein
MAGTAPSFLPHQAAPFMDFGLQAYTQGQSCQEVALKIREAPRPPILKYIKEHKFQRNLKNTPN